MNGPIKLCALLTTKSNVYTVTMPTLPLAFSLNNGKLFVCSSLDWLGWC